MAPRPWRWPPRGRLTSNRAIRLNLAAWRSEVVPPWSAGSRTTRWGPPRCLQPRWDSSSSAPERHIYSPGPQRADPPPCRSLIASHGSSVNHLAFSPRDGQFLFTSTSDQTAYAWELATGRPVRPPTRLPGEAWAVAWGRRDGSANGVRDRVGRRGHHCATRQGRPNHWGPLLRNPGLVVTAAFLPDDATLMVASRAVMRVWDPDPGVPKSAPPASGPRGVVRGFFFKNLLTGGDQPRRGHGRDGRG